jgi:DNA-binding NarL/FixJ family response regulator
MIGATKRVLVVENDDGIRESVVNRLRRRGFAADGAGTVAQTRALVTGQAAPFDVAVLDKAIQDPLHKTLTGFDLGHELRDAQPDMPPEFVVYSRHYKPEDYAQALELGISDYVVKSTNRAETIIDRIRLAALKSALNPVRPDLGERIERIAEKDLKVSTAVHQLCTEIIKPELDVCLGVPNIILISDSESIQVVNGNHRPGSERLYGEIQKGMLQHYGCTSFTFNKKNVPVPAAAADIVNNLEGGSFVSFNVMDEAQLSIGILPPRSSDALSEIDLNTFHELRKRLTRPDERFCSDILPGSVFTSLKLSSRFSTKLRKTKNFLVPRAFRGSKNSFWTCRPPETNSPY